MKAEESSSSPSFLEVLRDESSELEREVATQQAEKYELALLMLMRRSEDNPKLVNAMRDFVSELEGRALYGAYGEPLSLPKQEDLVDFFKDASARLGGKDTNGYQSTGWYIRKE